MSEEYGGGAEELLRRVPPHSVEAERAVLGSLLLDPRAIDLVSDTVLPEHFYRSSHAQILKVILDLYQQNQPIDVVLVNEELDRRGVLDEVGGTAALVELTENVPTSANAVFYAEIVRDHASRRNLITTAAEIQKDAYEDTGPTEDLLDRTERRLFEVTQKRIRSEAVVVSSVVQEAFERLQTIKQGGGVSGLPSGLADLDELSQGFQPGELSILAARPSMGKTSLALNVLRNVTLFHGRSGVFFSLEMPKLQVTMNILCSIAKIDGHRLRGGFLSREEERQFLDAAELLAKAPLYIDDTPGLTTMDLRAKARRLKSQHNIDIIMVDYLQLMSGSATSAKESRQQEVSEISRMIKALARELEVPVVALAQLSRKVEERKDHVPMMSDLRESGCLAGDTPVPIVDDAGARTVSIRELAGRAGFSVWALGADGGRLARASVSRAFATGIRPVFRITTADGRTIRATANHRFYTPRGWCRLDALAPGDALAAPAARSRRRALLEVRARRRARGGGPGVAVAPEAPAPITRSRPVAWDRIAAIVPAGEVDVYDLTVPDLHSFVAADLVVHNSIEQDADLIMLLHRPEYYDKEKEELRNKAVLQVAKNRNGPIGDVHLRFFRNQLRFVDATPD